MVSKFPKDIANLSTWFDIEKMTEIYEYSWVDGNIKHHIRDTDINKLKNKVLSKGLPWSNKWMKYAMSGV